MDAAMALFGLFFIQCLTEPSSLTSIGRYDNLHHFGIDHESLSLMTGLCRGKQVLRRENNGSNRTSESIGRRGRFTARLGARLSFNFGAIND